MKKKRNNKSFADRPTDKLFTAILFHLFSHPLICVCLVVLKCENDVKHHKQTHTHAHTKDEYTTGIAEKLHEMSSI